MLALTQKYASSSKPKDRQAQFSGTNLLSMSKQSQATAPSLTTIEPQDVLYNGKKSKRKIKKGGARYGEVEQGGTTRLPLLGPPQPHGNRRLGDAAEQYY